MNHSEAHFSFTQLRRKPTKGQRPPPTHTHNHRPTSIPPQSHLTFPLSSVSFSPRDFFVFLHPLSHSHPSPLPIFSLPLFPLTPCLTFVSLYSVSSLSLSHMYPHSSEGQPVPAGEFLWQRTAGVSVQCVTLRWGTLCVPALHRSSSGSLRRHHCPG